MRHSLIIAAASMLAIAGQAYAGQPAFPSAPQGPLPVLLYEVDYAVAGPVNSSQPAAGYADTIVTIGLPASIKGVSCPINVVWYDWNGVQVGNSGPVPLTAGLTYEFTTSNSGNQTEYVPFQENVFNSSSAPFEGYAQVTLDPSNCPTVKKLRIDAEFVEILQQPPGSPPTIHYKVINVTNKTGASGY